MRRIGRKGFCSCRLVQGLWGQSAFWVVVSFSFPSPRHTTGFWLILLFLLGIKPEDIEKATVLGKKMAEYAPHFKGPTTPEKSVKTLIKVIEEASVEGGDGGRFVSHLGGKQWL